LSTISPLLDQTNGASRMIDGSTPRPYVATRFGAPSDSVPTTTLPAESRVSADADASMSFHVQPDFGSGTPYLANSVRL
jgi:hypothetical protein